MTALAHPEVYRQSLLQGMTKCPRRTLHGLRVDDELAIGWVEHYGDLGTAWHEYMRRYLTTLGETWDGERGEQQMSTQEAIEIMYEVLADATPISERSAALPFTLPFDAMDELRGMVLGFCDIKWNPQILAQADLELEIRAEVRCPDGETRLLKGTPDVLMFDPPDGLLIIDAKSGRGRPRNPKGVEPAAGEVVTERKYLSDLFQGDTYSLLGMRRYPSARRVTFRELHLRSGQVRQGTLTREQLEHVERKLAVVMMQVARAITEGEESPLWRPRPGKHCVTQCPVARSCPIPEEMRGDGAIESQERADEVARLFAVSDAQHVQSAKQLKAWQEAGNPPGRANEAEEARWGPERDAWKAKGGGRGFKLWPVVNGESGVPDE